MDILFWIILIVALIVIGAVAVAKWTFRKGHKGYTKIRDRRDERRK